MKYMKTYNVHISKKNFSSGGSCRGLAKSCNDLGGKLPKEAEVAAVAAKKVTMELPLRIQ